MLTSRLLAYWVSGSSTGDRMRFRGRVRNEGRARRGSLPATPADHELHPRAEGPRHTGPRPLRDHAAPRPRRPRRPHATDRAAGAPDPGARCREPRPHHVRYAAARRRWRWRWRWRWWRWRWRWWRRRWRWWR